MQKDQTQRLLRAGLIAAAIAVVFGFGLHVLGAGGEAQGESDDEALPTPVRVKMLDGEGRMFVTQQDLAASGVATKPLETTTYQEEAPGFGTVISLQALVEPQQAYLMAAANAMRGKLAVEAAKLEVRRLQPLNQDNQIVSDKALEAARNALAAAEADFRASSAQLRMQQAVMEGQWGPILAGWLADDTPQLQRLLSGQEQLIQISLPMGPSRADAKIAEVEPEPGTHAEATIISIASQADPKFQGQSFYAVTNRDSRLRPGMAIPASVLIGMPIKGVIVPDAAIVKWQGQSWIFVRLDDGTFVRRPVVMNLATPSGWLVTAGLAAGTPLVVEGAQLLLSEEINVQPAGGDDK